MDWVTYKALCDRPDYWSRWMLEQTALIVEQAGAGSVSAKLRSAYEGKPLEKPADHKGPIETDMFALTLTKSERAEVVCALDSARWDAKLTNSAGFVAAWLEYFEWKEA